MNLLFRRIYMNDRDFTDEVADLLVERIPGESLVEYDVSDGSFLVDGHRLWPNVMESVRVLGLTVEQVAGVLWDALHKIDHDRYGC